MLAGSPEGDGCYGCLSQVALAALKVLWLLSQVALAKVVFSKLFRMEKKPSLIALARFPEGDGYYDGYYGFLAR